MKHHPAHATRPSHLTVAAGLAASLLAASPALSISDERFRLRWGDWETLGILGSDAVIGSIDGGQPNVNHASFETAEITQIAYPMPFNFGDQTFDRLNFITPHATAALGAIGARNEDIGGISDRGGIIGFAPESKLLAGSFAATLNPNTGTFIGATNESILFAMFALADQDFADMVWEPLGLPARYRVASVVNLPFGQSASDSQRSGSDVFAQLANVAATQTNATFVAAAGNEGDNQQLTDLNPEQGTMAAPGSAANVIAVGFTSSGIQGSVQSDSSRGPQPSIDWRVGAQLFAGIPETDFPFGVSPPSESPVFETRNGVDIVAPAVNLSLPGSPAQSGLNTTNFSTAWSGTSFSSAIVAGSIGLLHDLHRKLFFAANPERDEFDPDAVLSPLVTKAILFNSANKESNWNNGAAQGQGDGIEAGAVTTSTPFDEDSGAGNLDLRRMLRQYMGTPGLGGYRDITPDTLDVDGNPRVVAFRRNPDITDPDDPRMDIGTIPNFSPLPSAGYVMLDEVGFALRVPGTDPNVPLIEQFLNPDAGTSAAAPAMAPSTDRDETPQSGADAAVPSDRDAAPAARPDRAATRLKPMQLIPPNQGDGNDGGLETPGDGGSGGGFTGTGTGASTGGTSENTGGDTGTTSEFFSTGWDHGMIGKGTLDLPIGLVSEGSTITATLVWQRRMELDPRLINALAASVLPNNQAVASDMLLNSEDTRRAIEETAPYLPSARKTLEELKKRDQRLKKKTTPLIGVEDQPGEPTVMAGVRIPSDAEDPPFPPAESDTPADRIDPNFNADTNTPSLFNGVCFIEIPSTGRRFTGVAVSGGADGARHIITAAHPFDLDNNGTRDTSPSDIRIVFNGVPQFDEMGNITGSQSLELPTGSVSRVDIPDEFIGIGLTPSGQNRGFGNDIAVLTLRPETLGETNFNFDDFGIDAYPVFNGGTSTGVRFITVGYGESGQGDLGFASSDTPEGQVRSNIKRIGGNIVDRVSSPIFAYDFDGPGPPFIEGEFVASASLGNRNNFTSPNGMPVGAMNPVVFGETLHGEGDSGAPAFLWFDSGDGMGGPADGRVQLAELRLFGIATFRQVGNAQAMGAFGTTGGGQVLANFSSFISETLNPPPPPDPGDITPNVVFDLDAGRLLDLVVHEFQKLNLELWRLSFDGSGNQLTANSTSEWEQVELVRVTGDQQVPTGNYFVRIVYEGTQWDFGGFRFSGVESIPQVNARGVEFENLFDGDIEYGLAWFVDLERDRNLFPDAVQLESEDLMGDMNGDGLINGADLGSLLGLWGSNPETGRGDLNGDGVVDSGDLTILLKNYTGPSRTTTTASR